MKLVGYSLNLQPQKSVIFVYNVMYMEFQLSWFKNCALILLLPTIKRWAHQPILIAMNPPFPWLLVLVCVVSSTTECTNQCVCLCMCVDLYVYTYRFDFS